MDKVKIFWITLSTQPFKLCHKYPIGSRFPVEAYNQFSNTVNEKQQKACNMCHLHVIYLYFLSQKRPQQTRRQCFSRRRASDYGAVSSVWCVCSAPCVLYAGVWRADTPSVCAPARSCAITSLAAPGRLIRPPLPWRRPIWQEAKWCWRDHCHLGPNEIQLRPNVRQDDSKRWATLQPARQPARKTQRHICAKKNKK